MKVKFSVIPFIPAAIVMTVFKLMSVFGLDESGRFLGMNKMDVNYAVIGMTLGLFLLCVLINIFDRKTAPVYPVKKNPIAGILAVMTGAVVMGSSAVTLLNTPANSEYYITTLICAGLSVFAGIAFIVMSKVHFMGKSVISNISGLFVFPALWGCSELVSEFLKGTKVSISATDMTPLFCYIFITLYMFSHSMIVSRIKGRNSVKACFIYGLPAIALSVSYGVYQIVTSSIESGGTAQIINGLHFLVIALYMLSFIIEMTFNSYTKDEIEIIDGLPDDENDYESNYVSTDGYEDLVFSRKDGATEPNVEPADDYYKSSNGLDDFVLGYDREDNREPVAYVADEKFTQPQETEEKEEEVAPVELPATDLSNEQSKEEARMSEIDKLLQELESKK